ncbi:hypothetical protein PQR15_00830 [Streptomyces lydicus]|nr:hypothetical protein [Streptomyces lydicus]
MALLRLFAVFLPVTTVALVLLGATRGYGSVVPFVGVEQIGKPVLRVLLAVPLVLLVPTVTALSAAWLVPGVLGRWPRTCRCAGRCAGTPAPADPRRRHGSSGRSRVRGRCPRSSTSPPCGSA